MRERPREQLRIAAALERFRFERRVINVEELAAARVETPFASSCLAPPASPSGNFPAAASRILSSMRPK